MNSKIIKVSMVLIFMLFFAGLFNSVFALSCNTDYFVDVEFDFMPIKEFSVTNLSTSVFNTSYVNEDRLSAFISEYSLNSDNYELFYYFIGNEIDGSAYVVVHDTCKVEYPDMLTILYTNQLRCFRYPQYQGYTPVFKYNFELDLWCCEDLLCTSINSNLIFPVSVANCSTANVYLNGNTSSMLYEGNEVKPSIEINTVRTGVKTGYVEFTSKNWDSHMYYIKDDMDELVRLIAEEELSVIHPQVKHYDGPVDIEAGEYVMGILFDDDGEMIFSQISDGLEVNYDSVTDTSHHLYLDKENEDTYYLSIHGYKDGDYVEVSKYPRTDDFYVNDIQVLDSDGFEYNGLQIGYIYETALGHRNRKIKLSKNGITYFNLYDKDGNFINTCVLNSSNYYSGEDFDFDVELSFGNNKFDTDHKGLLSFLNGYFKVASATECISKYNHTSWVKVKPTVNVPSISNYELYLRISDYGTLEYIQEEDRNIFISHDNVLSNNIGGGIGLNSNTEWHRIDNLIYDYFYIATLQDTDATFSFELELRSKSGQILETKSFKVTLSASNRRDGLISSSTNGEDDTYVRNPNELASGSLNSNNFNFDGLNSSMSLSDLKNYLSEMVDGSIGFFSLLSTFLLLLPTWISSLLYFFLFGIIVITLYRFVRGA